MIPGYEEVGRYSEAMAKTATLTPTHDAHLAGGVAESVAILPERNFDLGDLASDPVKLTPEQDAYLEEFLDHLIGMAEAAGRRANEIGVAEGLPTLTPEERAAKPDTGPQIRAELRRHLAPQIAQLSSGDLKEKMSSIREKSVDWLADFAADGA